MQWNDFERCLLALTLWREDRGGGLDGMKAVACVIRNRAHRWNKSYTNVLETKNAFSSLTYLGDSQTVAWPPDRDQLFTDTLAMVDGIYDNSTPDITSNANFPLGALYYAHVQTIDKGGWFDRNIIQNPAAHPLIGYFGGQAFYV